MANPPLFAALAFIFMCGPALGGIAAALAHDKGRRLDALGLCFRFGAGRAWVWLFWAWAIPVLLVLGAMIIDWLGPQAAPADPAAQIEAALRAQGADPQSIPMPPALLAVIQIGFALTFAPFINMLATLSEELGWRGWLWDRWRRFGFWRGNIAIGAVWGVWHAPLIAMGYNYPGMPLAGPVLMVLFCVMLAPLIGLVRERGGGVWHAGLFHGTINAFTGVGLVLLTRDTGFPWLGLLGAGGLAAGTVAWALVWLDLRRAPLPPHPGVH